VTEREVAERVRHDLGKAVVFEASWLSPAASTGELRAALREDLLRTRRGPSGTASAAEIWSVLRASLGPHARAPEVAAIDAAMARLGAELPALDADPPDPAALAALAALAESVRGSCYAWVARTRRS
jgi:hypothetical protein